VKALALPDAVVPGLLCARLRARRRVVALLFRGRLAGKWRQNHHKVFVTLTCGGCWPRTTTGIL